MRISLLLTSLVAAAVTGTSVNATPSLYFIENRGQVTDQYYNTRPDVNYRLSAGSDLQIFLGEKTIHYQWNKQSILNPDVGSATPVNSYRMDVQLLGANPKAHLQKEQPIPYYELYYTSNLKGVRANAFRSVTYKDIYPNIDWVLYINPDGKLEYDFKVKPGGKVSDIRIQFTGATSLQVNKDGSLTAVTPMGSITEKAPVSFQEDGRPVASRFVLEDNILRFATDAYEGTLTIDPVLEWSTYFGGTGSDIGRSAACDTKGGVYMTGSASSASNIATTGAHQVTYGASGDAFLVKFDSSGSRIWATYYGGSGDDQGWSVACDEADNVYTVGQTASASGIASQGVHQGTNGGGAYDAYIAKFNGNGQLHWATYYGGSGSDEGWGVTCNKKGYIYITGRTGSSTGIATDATTYKAKMDAFLVKMDTAGRRQWGTYLGGEGDELTWAISCDTFDHIYISGETGSATGMATPGAHQTQMTANNGSEAFLAGYTGSGTLRWCTYYGGNQSGQVFGTGIACDHSGDVVATGYTVSTVDIATPGAHQTIKGSGYDSYLVKFDSLGKRIWGTYYGGNGIENGYGVATDRKGNIYIAGYTTSKENIATDGAFQTTPSTNASNDFYVAKFSEAGTLLWGTYYGQNGYDAAFSVAHDQVQNIYVSGFANGNGLGTTNAFQPNLGGSFDGLLMRISECVVGSIGQIEGPDSVCVQTTGHVYKVPPVYGASGYSWKLPDGWTGSGTSDSIIVTVGAEGGTIEVFAYSECDTTPATSLTITISALERPVISVEEFDLSTHMAYATYQWLLNGQPIQGAEDRTYHVEENGDYRVIVTNEEGCVDTSDVYHISNVGSGVEDIQYLGRVLKIYPNPAGDIIYIQGAADIRTKIISLEGKLIRDVGKARQVSLEGLAEGLYFVSLYTDSGRLIRTEKLVIVR